MSEATWKMVVDQRGVTIKSDRFQLTTSRSRFTDADISADADSLLTEAQAGEMESILSELQTMTRGTYGQFCGLSRALEMIGERWAMLIIRDLFVGPKQFSELREGLPLIPPATLSARLKELERTRVIQCRVKPPAFDSSGYDSFDDLVVYELTPYGRQLESAIVELSRWGARSLGQPRPEDIVTVESMIMALRTTFHPEAAKGVRAGYELRIGDITIHARVDDGHVRVGEGPLANPDLVIEPGLTLREIMAGELSPTEAVRMGKVRVTGDDALFERFAEMFTFRSTRPAVSAGSR